MLLEKLDALGDSSTQVAEIERAALQGVLSDLTKELHVLENRECEHCEGISGGHVSESCGRG